MIPCETNKTSQQNDSERKAIYGDYHFNNDIFYVNLQIGMTELWQIASTDTVEQ